MTADEPIAPIRKSYDTWAPDYVATFGDELTRKPFDREVLEEFAARVPADGPVLDVGCGPGQIGEYVRQHGPCVCGLDLSHGMLAQARMHHPQVSVAQGSMLELPFCAQSVAGLVAFYCIIHLQRDQVPGAFKEFARVLKPGAPMIVSVHRGDGDVHVDVPLNSRPGKSVPMYALWFQPEPLQETIEEAGFCIDEIRTRGPYDFEETHRIYVLATRYGSSE